MIGQLHSLIQSEMTLIAQYNAKTVLHRWMATLYVKGQAVSIQFINAVEFNRDYLLRYSDVIGISIKIDPVMYEQIVYPNRDSLELSLIKRPIASEMTGGEKSEQFQYQRYRAQLFETQSDAQSSSNILTSMPGVTNVAALRDLELQIYDKALDFIRISTYSTNHRNSSGMSVIRSIIGNYATKPGDNVDTSVISIDVQSGYSTEVRPQIVIPQGVPIGKIPSLVNELSGGLYNTGFGHYIQQNMWYIFSPFNVKRYQEGGYKKSLTVINVPPTMMPGIEKTFRDTGTQLIILTTGKTDQLDITSRSQLNLGTGVRFADPNQLKENGTKYESGQVEADPKRFISEFAYGRRPDGDDYISSEGNRITANYRQEYSKLAERQGTYISTIWENSISEEIYPGMPVKYVYIEKGSTVVLYGTVCGIISRSVIGNSDPYDPIYTQTSFIKMFIQRSAS